MPQSLLSDQIIENSIETYLPKVTVRSQIIYIVVILALTAGLASLPFIYVNVSIRSPGVIRPVAEKTKIKSLKAGQIDQILVRNEQYVKKDQTLIILDNDKVNSQLKLNQFLIQKKRLEIQDLQILVGLSENTYDSVQSLSSPLYRQQYNQLIFDLSDNITMRKKALRHLHIKEELFDKGIIAVQNIKDQKSIYKKTVSSFNIAFEQQLSSWQDALDQAKIKINQLEADRKQLLKQKTINVIKAPVSGTIQQFQGTYVGNYIQPGEVLGIISPDSGLIAECYVKPSDIGLIKEKMAVRFQVDAFDYNQWGLLDGTVIKIPKDVIRTNNISVFIVRCRLNQGYLTLKNGYRGMLKKGMSLHGRFIVTRRSLYQLLYDKIDDWLNPQTDGKQAL